MMKVSSALRPLTILYLLLPAVLFSAGWLRLPVAVLNIGMLLVFAWAQIRALVQTRLGRGEFRAHWGVWLSVAVVLLGWVLLSGVGGFGFQVKDYDASNALLRDLIFQPWPLTITLNGEPLKYVYYLAYFLPAAAVGKLLGWAAANYFLLAWTVVGVGLSFGWFAHFVNAPVRRGAWLAIFFCFAGGLDFFGHLFFQNPASSISAVTEWWAGYFQYSGNTTLFFWVPQQALPGWLMTGLVLSMFERLNDSRELGLIVALGLLWSPLAVIGLLPFCVLLIFEQRSMRPGRSWWLENFFGLWLVFVHALYISSNRLDFPKGFIGSTQSGFGLDALKVLPVFWALEFALLGGLVAWIYFYRASYLLANEKPSETETRWLVVSLVTLIALPLFRFGVNNDLVMRGGIPALFVLWIIVAKLLFTLSVESRTAVRAAWLTVLLMVCVGMYSGLYAVTLSVRKYHAGPPALMEVPESASANTLEIVSQRLGDGDSLFYRLFGK